MSFHISSTERTTAGVALVLQWCVLSSVCVCVCRFGCWLAGCHPSVLPASLPQTPDAGEELQHQGQVWTARGGKQLCADGLWRWCRWWMLSLLFLPPQGAGWNSAETSSFGARRRVCEFDYVTYCACTNSLWCHAQMHAHADLRDLSLRAQTLACHSLILVSSFVQS